MNGTAASSHVERLETAPDAAARTILRHNAILREAIDQAEASFRRGAVDVAAVRAEIAANFAMCHHPGVFASSRIERLLGAIGRTIPAPDDQRRLRFAADGSRPRVLHVLTRAGDVGGDTRLVWRWIEQDDSRTHSVALTRQGAQPVPRRLKQAVEDAGGQITILNTGRGSLRAWAAQLRAAATSADYVVLHTHACDIVPALAFAGPDHRPPVLYVDHADHTFWVGVTAVNIVVALRDSGLRLARARRGVDAGHQALLPTILSPIARAIPRQQAKAQLGLAPDTTVLLSIARPHKYTPVSDGNFLDALLPVVEAHEDTVLLVVGPEQTGAWSAAHDRTGGRVRALGTRSDTALFYQAADIYLDSFPVTSITSLLEAGSYGLPLLTRATAGLGGSVLASDAPGLKGRLLESTSVDSFQRTLTRLIADIEFRETLGEETRQKIQSVHLGCCWQQLLESAYEQAAAVTRISTIAEHVDRFRAGPVDLMLPRVFTDEPWLDQIAQFHLRLLPTPPRAREWIRLTAARRQLLPGLLLPEWFGTRVESRRNRPATPGSQAHRGR